MNERILKERLHRAKEYFDAGLDQECLSEVEAILREAPKNSEALSLQEQAEDRLLHSRKGIEDETALLNISDFNFGEEEGSEAPPPGDFLRGFKETETQANAEVKEEMTSGFDFDFGAEFGDDALKEPADSLDLEDEEGAEDSEEEDDFVLHDSGFLDHEEDVDLDFDLSPTTELDFPEASKIPKEKDWFIDDEDSEEPEEGEEPFEAPLDAGTQGGVGATLKLEVNNLDSEIFDFSGGGQFSTGEAPAIPDRSAEDQDVNDFFLGTEESPKEPGFDSGEAEEEDSYLDQDLGDFAFSGEEDGGDLFEEPDTSGESGATSVRKPPSFMEDEVDSFLDGAFETGEGPAATPPKTDLDSRVFGIGEEEALDQPEGEEEAGEDGALTSKEERAPFSVSDLDFLDDADFGEHLEEEEDALAPSQEPEEATAAGEQEFDFGDFAGEEGFANPSEKTLAESDEEDFSVFDIDEKLDNTAMESSPDVGNFFGDNAWAEGGESEESLAEDTSSTADIDDLLSGFADEEFGRDVADDLASDPFASDKTVDDGLGFEDEDYLDYDQLTQTDGEEEGLPLGKREEHTIDLASSLITSQDNQDAFRADRIRQLWNEGIDLYRGQDFSTAIAKMEELLEVDPENEGAKNYIEMARGQMQQRDQTAVSTKASLETTGATHISSRKLYDELVADQSRSDEDEGFGEELKGSGANESWGFEAVEDSHGGLDSPFDSSVNRSGGSDSLDGTLIKDMEKSISEFLELPEHRPVEHVRSVPLDQPETVDLRSRPVAPPPQEMVYEEELESGRTWVFRAGVGVVALIAVGILGLYVYRQTGPQPASQQASTVEKVEKAPLSAVKVEDEKLAKQYFSQGVDLYQAKRYTEAREQFQLFLNMAPGDPQASGYLAKIDAEEGRMKKDQDRQRRQASIQQLYAEGEQQFKAGKYKESIDKMRAVVDLDPGNSGAQYTISRAKEELQRIRLETERQEKIEGLLAKAKEATDGKDFDKALALYSEVQSLDPENTSAREGISTSKEGLHQYRLDQVRILLNEGQEHYKFKRFYSCIETMKKVMALEPENPSALNYYDLSRFQIEMEEHRKKGLQLFRAGNYQEAIAELDILLAKIPEDPEGLKIKGWAESALELSKGK